MFRCLGTKLNMSSTYHSQNDGQSKVVNRCLETYLRCTVSDKPKDWFRWLVFVKWWYNTTFHSATNTTPYEIVYGQAAPVHLPYLLRDSKIDMVDKSLQAREAAIKLLKFHLYRTRNKMKQQANHKRSDRQFKVGNMVYIKLQPYR